MRGASSHSRLQSRERHRGRPIAYRCWGGTGRPQIPPRSNTPVWTTGRDSVRIPAPLYRWWSCWIRARKPRSLFCWARRTPSKMSGHSWRAMKRQESVANTLAATRQWWDSTLSVAPGQDAFAFDRSPAESLASVPVFELQILGTVRALSIRRSVRLPRSVAGFDGVCLCGAANHAKAYSALGWRGSLSKATSSTGGIPGPVWACERSAPTICSGCRSPLRNISRSREIPAS